MQTSFQGFPKVITMRLSARFLWDFFGYHKNKFGYDASKGQQIKANNQIFSKLSTVQQKLLIFDLDLPRKSFRLLKAENPK